MTPSSFPLGGTAIICGATGGIGAALRKALEDAGAFSSVLGFSRSSTPPLDLEDERTIAAIASSLPQGMGDLRLVFDATGLLHDGALRPEKTFGAIDPAAMAKSFAVNATGPALLMKHLLPLFPRQGKAVFATLSAKVGSIGDNRLGGWYATARRRPR